MGAHHGIRLLSANDRVDRITISNVTGSIRERFINISPFFPGMSGNFGSISFSNINIRMEHFPFWWELYPEQKILAARNAYEAELSSGKHPGDGDPGEEATIPFLVTNGRIDELRIVNSIVAISDRSRPALRIGANSHINELKVDLAIADPEAHSIPVKLMGRVDRMDLSLDWSGNTPIEYKGGKVGTLKMFHKP
jgi:hypothetical protein